MPFYLEESDIEAMVAGLRSVLIVPCGFCPAVSLAVRENQPYIEIFRRFLKTGAYESYIKDLAHRLEAIGIKTDVFKIKMPQHMVACMWTAKRRKALAIRAAAFDATVVLGCSAAVENVRDAVVSRNSPVIQGMEISGLMNLLPEVRFPFTISLRVKGMTSVEEKGVRSIPMGKNVLMMRPQKISTNNAEGEQAARSCRSSQLR